MRIKEILLSEKDLPRVDVLAIVASTLGLTTEGVLAASERTLNPREAGTIGRLVGERRKGRPVAYLTNRREFFSETFYVDERVLIPRPETELLVEEAMEIVRRKRTSRVLDMGTGSGIIGILLAKAGAASVTCVDISPGALAVADKNARRLSVRERVSFCASDLFSALKEGTVFDLVCANLPYVAACEWDGLMVDVRGFEPKCALVAGAAGTESYERCISEMPAHLAPGASVLFEIGGDAQGASLSARLQDAGFETAVLADLAGRQRLLRGLWKSL